MNVTNIQVPFPGSNDLHIKITVGACRIKVTSSEGADWVTGTYEDPSGTLPCKIQQDGGNVLITQDPHTAEMFGLLGGRVPRFDLALGKATPFKLTLETGASEGYFDLGGVPLSNLNVRQGAGKIDFDFSAPNPQAMRMLDLDAGAAGIEMRNLANANFDEMTADGGAAAYRFDFGGKLQRPGVVRITTGMSGVDIRVPATLAARITTEAVLGGVDVGDGFMKKQGAFWTEAALAGATPMLEIRASVTMGGLHLLQR